MKIIAVNKNSSLPNSSGVKLRANKPKAINPEKIFRVFAIAYSPEPFANEEKTFSWEKSTNLLSNLINSS